MTQALTIVTGASSGLGLALVEQLLARGERVLAIARRAPPIEHAALTVWRADLADPLPVAARLAQWLGELDPAQLDSVSLVNNAGVVSTPQPLAASDGAELSNALRVGLEAPLVLSAAFLRATAAWKLPRKLLMISSGLGRRAMASSASYCAAKAGMDHLARVIALEEAAHENGARVVALSPGIIDTPMQATLRGADPAAFPERGLFVGWKEGGELATPAAAAKNVLDYLARPDFGTDPIGNLRAG